MPATEWFEILAAGVGSATAGAGVTGLINRRKQNAETDAVEVDSAQQIVNMAMTLMKPMQDKIDELTEQTKRLSDRVKHLEDENACLRSQIIRLET